MGEGSPSSRASHARSGSCPPPTAARSSGPCSTPPGHAHQPAQGVLSLPPRSRPYSPTPAAWPDCFSVPAPAPTQPDTPSPQQGAETKRPPGEGHGSRQPKATSRSAAASRRGLEPTVSNKANTASPCCGPDSTCGGCAEQGASRPRAVRNVLTSAISGRILSTVHCPDSGIRCEHLAGGAVLRDDRAKCG